MRCEDCSYFVHEICTYDTTEEYAAPCEYTETYYNEDLRWEGDLSYADE